MTTLELLNVPLENDYLHTLYFETREQQTAYFKKQVVHSGADYTYQRKDSRIRYPLSYDQLVSIGANYVHYVNDIDGETMNKYAFITRIEYVNEDMSNIYIETDVMQTWLNEYTLRPSFVEREHVADDSIGANTVPEGLETGEYVVDEVIHHDAFKFTEIPDFIVGSTVDPNGKGSFKGNVYNGVFSGVGYYLMEWRDGVLDELEEGIQNSNKTSTEAIQSIFVCPPASKFFKAAHDSEDSFPLIPLNTVINSFRWNNPDYGTVSNPTRPTKLDGYTPINKKLLTYPYNYLLMSNNAGGSAVYQYEHFKNIGTEGCEFKIYWTICPGFSIRLVPMNYKKCGEELSNINNDEGLVMAKLPICSWSTDTYTNWLTQNALNVAVNTAVSMGTMVYGAVSGNGGAILGGAMGVFNQVNSVYEHSKQPPQASGNVNGGDVSYGMNMSTFSAYKMTIKKEYARIIDNFFTMYGYKVCQLKVPNYNHKSRYWYTKTIDVNLDAISVGTNRKRGIPHEDLLKIKACYNTGITFWKDTENVGVYPDSINSPYLNN